ncbi:MAG: NAD(P)H-hydrate dehydratase [Planctomycetaceae bacterium]|nr:NAD(P)H-hydrate dehydratase [Planctomycetaceae bacterium]
MKTLFRQLVRSADTHKGDYGRALLIGGSVGMSGAISLAGLAALHTGSGLVRLAVPKTILPVAASLAPEYMTIPLKEDEEGRINLANLDKIIEIAEDSDVVAIGPGLGRSPEIDTLVVRLNKTITKPMVMDADALNAIAADGPEMTRKNLAESAGIRILTPHPGEFSRLSGQKITKEPNLREQFALEYAQKWNVLLVLKGYRTVVSNGNECYVNQTGNPGMAVGGSGDVLTGIITSLAGQHILPFESAKMGVYLHGLAGDMAFSNRKNICHSILPTELIRNIHTVLDRFFI